MASQIIGNSSLFRLTIQALSKPWLWGKRFHVIALHVKSALVVAVLGNKSKDNTGPHGPLTRYVKLRAAHAPGMTGKLFPAPDFKCAVMHVGIVNPRWWVKRSRHSRRMRNPLFCVSGKRPMANARHETCYLTCTSSNTPSRKIRCYLLNGLVSFCKTEPSATPCHINQTEAIGYIYEVKNHGHYNGAY